MLMFFVGTWRGLAFRALAAIAFGILTLVWPGITLWALVVLFGAYALVDGVFTLVDAARSAPGARARRPWHIVEGLAGIAAGVIAFVWPGITALALLFLIAAWAFVAGAMRIAAAYELRGAMPNVWLVALGGVLSIAFGAILVITPGAGALVITWLIGWYALFLGVLEMALALRVRQIEHQAEQGISGMRPAAA
ncbi:MAG: hypothetical protein JWL83_1019 [Actinomycetia bacterium]|nr:hypothetical protein [Actinomycetes bacterium]